MKIVIDSREQKPLVFKCEFIKDCLLVGDYGARFSDNHQHSTVFERKSLGDTFGTLTSGYPRFRREIERSIENNIQLVIIIEVTRERILKGYAHSKREGTSILIQLDTISKKYGIEVVFCKNRKEMSKYIEEFYLNHYEEYIDTINLLPEKI